MFNRLIRSTIMSNGFKVVRHSNQHSAFERLLAWIAYKTQRCAYCGWRKATWSHIPSWRNACDKCLPRGCDCTLELKPGIAWDSPAAQDPNNYTGKLDDQGRRLPCYEWSPILPPQEPKEPK